MDDTNLDDLYIDTLSQYGKEVFRDFLSDLSRKRQANLMVSAVVTILLAFAIIEPIESEFAGIKFTFTDVRIIPIITGAICLYFLATYLIGALQDWQLTKYRTLPARTNSNKLFDRLEVAMQQHVKGLDEHLEDLKAQGIGLQQLQKQLQKPLKGHWQKQLLEMDERQQLEIKGMKEKGASMSDIMLAEKKHFEEQEELLNAELKAQGYMSSSKDILNQKQQHTDDDSWFDKAQVFYKTVQKYVLYRNANVLIEIIFPSTLALFAIGSAIWRILH